MAFLFRKPQFSEKLTLWWVLLVGYLMLFPPHVSSFMTSPNSEANALLKWKASLDNQSQTRLSTWRDNSTHPCKWYGILCNEFNSVSYISLEALGLRGTLDGLNFSSFPNLQFIHIQLNSLYGNIPPHIGELSKLRIIDFSYNEFSGSIPTSIGNLSSLTNLYLGQNNLSRALFPDWITKMTRLNALGLSSNHFTGRIPDAIGNLTNLSWLGLNNNTFSGHVPLTMGNLVKLSWLHLGDNYFSGSILPQIERMPNLYFLAIGGNQFTDAMPRSHVFGSIP